MMSAPYISYPQMIFPPIFAEGLTKAPVPLFNLGGFQVNNSMVISAIASLVIIGVVQYAMRAPKLVPTGIQNFVEWIVELMSDFIANITGRETMLRGFWFFASLFVFIFAENFFSLIPGVGTIGWGHHEGAKFIVDRPFLRGANANVNLTAAYSVIFFFLFFYWSLRVLTPGQFLYDIFGSKVKFPNFFLNLLFVVIFFLVGIMEAITILFIRVIAFTFRLYGNIFGGESFLDTIYRTAPNFFLAVLFLIPGYLWEFVVAFVQSFVFFILTVVFTGILTNAHGTPTTENKHAH
jgi:F-type H+-transporting ATPase subunit a